MSNQPIIRKASGETEPFLQQKLEASLQRAGAGEETISDIKVMLAQNGIVLCRQLLESPEEIASLGLTSQQRKKLEKELEELCS